MNLTGTIYIKTKQPIGDTGAIAMFLPTVGSSTAYTESIRGPPPSWATDNS